MVWLIFFLAPSPSASKRFLITSLPPNSPALALPCAHQSHSVWTQVQYYVPGTSERLLQPNGETRVQMFKMCKMGFFDSFIATQTTARIFVAVASPRLQFLEHGFLRKLACFRGGTADSDRFKGTFCATVQQQA